MERRLAAILAADVVGYSRLIREDEAGTLAALKAHREQLIAPKVAERKGCIVKLILLHVTPQPYRRPASVSSSLPHGLR